MFYLIHTPSNSLVHYASTGQHDVIHTNRYSEAASFDTLARASEYSQNFGDEYEVETVY